MKGSAKRFGIYLIIVAFVLLAATTITAIAFFFNINQFKPELESRLSQGLGREVKVGHLKLDLFSGSIKTDHLSIADNRIFSPSPFVHAKSLKIGADLKTLLLSKTLRIKELWLNNPAITIIQSPGGRWNFSDLVSQGPNTNQGIHQRPDSSPITSLVVHQLSITGGRVTIIRPYRKASIYEGVNISFSNISLASQFPFALTASLPANGKLELNGKAGPLYQTDLLLTPLQADLNVTHLDLLGSGFFPGNSGISGFIDFSGTFNSDGKKVRSQGRATARNLQLVKNGSPAGRPVYLDYIVEYDLRLQQGTLADVKVRYGNAIAHLNGDYDLRGIDPAIKMRLQGSRMPLQDLQTLLPAFGVILPRGALLEGGLLDVEMEAEGPVGNMVTAGVAQISQVRLVGFDLAGKMAAVALLAGLKSSNTTEIEKFFSEAQLTREGIDVRRLQLIIPALGEITGSGKINPDQSLDFKMHAAINPPGGIARGLARLAGGILHVPFFIRGTACDPKFFPDLKGTAGGLLGFAAPDADSNKQSEQPGDLGDKLRDLFRKKK